MNKWLGLFLGLLSVSAWAQKGCVVEENAYAQVTSLPEVDKQIKACNNVPRCVFFTIDPYSTAKREFYEIKEFLGGEFMNHTIGWYYVDKESCKVYRYDVVSARVFTLEQWNQVNWDILGDKTKEGVRLFDLFYLNGSIDFGPEELNLSTDDKKEFLAELTVLEKNYPSGKGFEVDNLLFLVNNEFTESRLREANTKWLNYFISKFNIDVSVLHSVMKEAITELDLAAMKTIFARGYIVSEKDLSVAKRTKKGTSSTRIDEITNMLTKKYKANKINDPDGYTNLRKDKTTKSSIVSKVPSGEQINVLDNTGNWLLIETKDGVQGYVYRNRVKSE